MGRVHGNLTHRPDPVRVRHGLGRRWISHGLLFLTFSSHHRSVEFSSFPSIPLDSADALYITRECHLQIHRIGPVRNRSKDGVLKILTFSMIQSLIHPSLGSGCNKPAVLITIVRLRAYVPGSSFALLPEKMWARDFVSHSYRWLLFLDHPISYVWQPLRTKSTGCDACTLLGWGEGKGKDKFYILGGL